MKKTTLAVLLALSAGVMAQDKPAESNFGIKFNGFVKTDFFYDTREVINSREGHFLLYPDAPSLDKNGEDIKEHPSTNFLSIQSRLTGAISGPNAFGAKTSGVLEADFFGNLNDENGFRLRHAFAKLNWKRTELLMGQTWHPMFVAECFPGTVSFNTGAPFQPFSRNPQIKLSQKMGFVKVIGTMYTQRDFTGTGPDGASSKYLRNSSLPNAHVQLQFKSDSSDHIFGIGADYKSIVPETFTNSVTTPANKYKSSETLNSLSFIAYGKLDFSKFVVRMEGVYAQNAYDMTMLGGYAVKEVTDATTGAKTFTNLNTGSAWIDMNTKGKKVQVGLFAGYSVNMGSNDSIKSTIYARNADINDMYRIAPRVVFIAGKMNLALEVEHTVASYGTKNADGKGGVLGCEDVANTRFLASCMYKF